MSNVLYFAKTKKDALIPTKAVENAGYDIYACFEDDYMVIRQQETVLVPTGIATAFSSDYVLILKERGSTGTKGMAQRSGVIDSGYRGEILAPITNVSDKDIIISKLTREELIKKYGKKGSGTNPLIYLKETWDSTYPICLQDDDPDPLGNIKATIYPYNKAIAQGVLIPVPKVDTKEIPYGELVNIPSERGTGMLGSSGK